MSDIKSIKYLASIQNNNEALKEVMKITSACEFPIEWKNKCKIDWMSENNGGICDAFNKGSNSKEFSKLMKSID